MTCRTCEHLFVPPRRDGKIVPDSRYAYECRVPMPERQAVPACAHLDWPPRRYRMEPDSGEGCTFYVKRAPLKTKDTDQ